jgi:hypothetical protein
MQSFHHAYLLLGDKASSRSRFESYLDTLGMKRQGNPDLFVYETEAFGIDEARALRDRAQDKSFGDKKVFGIFTSKITLEAQNALLKTFEEPYEKTYFFIAVREEGILIPTLRSRMELVRISRSESQTKESESEQFLKMSVKERMNFSKKFSDNEGDLASFLDNLLIVMKKRNQGGILPKVLNTRRYAHDRSVSRRLILEHLATVLPS